MGKQIFYERPIPKWIFASLGVILFGSFMHFLIFRLTSIRNKMWALHSAWLCVLALVFIQILVTFYGLGEPSGTAYNLLTMSLQLLIIITTIFVWFSGCLFWHNATLWIFGAIVYASTYVPSIIDFFNQIPNFNGNFFFLGYVILQ